jgi:hypothetical protein
MANSTTFSGVGVEGMSWTLHVAPTATQAAVGAHHAIPRPTRRAAAATVASVNRGTT